MQYSGPRPPRNRVNDSLSCTLPLIRWQGERGIYHLVTITGEAAESIVMHERLHRLEFGSSRGFGSVKVTARIGTSRWKTSVFPQHKQTEWVLLISKKIVRAEDLVEGDSLNVELKLL